MLQLILFLPLLALSAPNDAFSDLEASAQKRVRAELQTFLIGGLPEGYPREYATYLSTHTEDWIQAFGDIHAGHPDKAITLMMQRGSGVLYEHLKSVVPGDSALAVLLEQSASRSDMMISLGRAIADPGKSWGDVGQVFWKQAKQELEDKIAAGSPRALMKSALNTVLTDRDMQGWTVGDLYLLGVDTWVEIVKVQKKSFAVDTENALFDIYQQERSSNGASVAADRIDEAIASGRLPGSGSVLLNERTFFSGLMASGLTQPELIDLFERFYAERLVNSNLSYQTFHNWLEDGVNAKLNQLEKHVKAEALREAKRATERVRREAAEAHRIAARKLAELIEKELTAQQKAEREKATVYLGPVLEALRTLTIPQLEAACARYYEQRKALVAIYARYAGANKILWRSERAAERVLEHADLISAIEPFSAELLDLEERLSTIGDYLEIVDVQGDAVCEAASEVDEASEKADGRPSLDRAVAASGKVERAHEKLVDAISSFVADVESLSQRHETSSSPRYSRFDLERDLRDIRQALQDREKEGEEKRLFDGHKVEMQLALEKCEKLAASIQDDRKLIAARLAGHNPNASVQAFWAELARAEEIAKCAPQIRFDWRFGSDPHADALAGKSPSTLRFPRYSSDDSVEPQRRALASTGSSGEIESFSNQLSEAKDFAKRLDGLKHDIASMKFTADMCLLHALDTYSALPGEAVVTAGDPNDVDVWTEPEEPRELEAPDTVPYIVKVAGSGWTPHYAGGSYIHQGMNTQVLWVKRDVSAETAIEALRAQLEGASVCDKQIPAFPGMSKRPSIWNVLTVDKVRGPILDQDEINAIQLENTWVTSDDDGPSLGELRKRAGCN